MAIPGYESMMLPILQLASDGLVHRASEATNLVINHFDLTDADQQEMLPSGTAKTLVNRVHWALTYLRHADVIRAEGRGHFALTDRGRQLLQTNPPRIDKAVLSQYPEFVAFVGGTGSTVFAVKEPAAPAMPPVPPVSEATLEETLDQAYSQLKRQFEHALLERIKATSPEFFERLVIKILVKMGYGGTELDAASHLGKTGDGGIDGLIKQDKLGLESIFIQAKRWQGTVGRPEIQAFVGSLEGRHARKGVFMTTASFSPDAHHYVSTIEKRVILIDGQLLVRLMLEYGVGVSVERVYPVYSMDEAFFTVEEPSLL